MRERGLDGRTGRLLALTCATGMVDAVAFLGLGQVFCAMQTGNVVFLGLGIAGAAGAPDVAAPLTAICAYLAGGVAAATLPRAALGTAVALELALLALATALAAAFDPRAGEAAALLCTAALAAAMGLRTTTVRRRGGANLATTVLNLTVVGAESGAGGAASRAALAAPAGVASRAALATPAGGASRAAPATPAGGASRAAPATPAGGAALAAPADLAQRGAALAALLGGAVAGALLLEAALWLPLALATAITLATHALDRPPSAAA